VVKRKHSVWALTLGALAMVLSFTFLARTSAVEKRRFEAELASATRLVKVVVATRDLPEGTLIERGDVKTVRAVQAHLPEGILPDIGSVVGKEIVADVYAGEPFHLRRLPTERTSRAASIVGDGMVALAVGVDDVTGVAGGIRPGDRVDVLIVERESERARRLLSSVRVLGTNGSGYFAPEAREEAALSQTREVAAVVLELTPADAVRVADAAEYGPVRLALRGHR